MPSAKRLINRARSSRDMVALTALISKAESLDMGPVKAALARRANQLGSHDLALSLVDKFVASEPSALREAIAAALALDDAEIFDDCEFNLENMLRRSRKVAEFRAEHEPLRLCEARRRRKAATNTPIPDRWLPKAARVGSGAQGGAGKGSAAPFSGTAPSSAQVEVSKAMSRRARR